MHLSLIHRLYYFIRPIIPRVFQLFIRSWLARFKKQLYKDVWPINAASAKLPEGWPGWPENKKFALVLTHDVDTFIGHSRCRDLAELEKKLGFHSSFNFVPERYAVSADLRKWLQDNGFEVGVHGLNHDGKLYFSYNIFQERAQRINHYLKSWQAVGFRSPAMHHNLEWIHALQIEYDASTFDFDPFEPQNDGMYTIFPFRVVNKKESRGYIELPYTLPQDSTLYLLLKERDISTWKEKLDWISAIGGMVLLNTHPDYMNFSNQWILNREYPIVFYKDILTYIKEKYHDAYWHILPREIAAFWRKINGKIQHIQ